MAEKKTKTPKRDAKGHFISAAKPGCKDKCASESDWKPKRDAKGHFIPKNKPCCDKAKDKAKRCCKVGVAEMLAELIRDGYVLGMDFEEKEAYPYHVWFDRIVRIGGKDRGMHADCHGKDAIDAFVGAIIETYEQDKRIRDGQCKDLLKAIFGGGDKAKKKKAKA